MPDNLTWLGGAGVLIAIVAFLCVWARLIHPNAKRWLIITSAVSLICLLAMRIQLVEHFDYYGEPFDELRGWSLSPYGETAKANLETSLRVKLSMHDVIDYSGHASIVQLFGVNWYLCAALYAGFFLLFMYSVITVAGRFELDSKDEH